MKQVLEEGVIEKIDIHELFRYYDFKFFSGKLQGVLLEWSERMTLCAGLCYCHGGKNVY